MLDMMIAAAIASASPEMKSALKKVNEFVPMIDTFHSTIPLKKEQGELGISYLLRFEEKGIILYQVALASRDDVNNGKPFVNRQLNKWNITEKIDEITKGL